MRLNDVRRSTMKVLGLPDKFGEVVLIFAFVLAISPLLAGADFGIFLVPNFDRSQTQLLKYVGPGVLAIVILLFIPVWPQQKEENLEAEGEINAAKRLIAELLLELRNRFRLALARTKDRDRVDFPRAWSSNLLEGGGDRKFTENSHDLVTRIRAFLSTLALENASHQLAEVSKLLSSCSSLDSNLQNGPAEEKTWGVIKEHLDRGYALVDSSLEDTGLVQYLAKISGNSAV